MLPPFFSPWSFKGTLRPGTPICVPGRRNLRLGKVVKIEANHVERQKASEGDEVAVSIDPGGISVMYGRQFDANDRLFSFITRRSIVRYYCFAVFGVLWLTIVRQNALKSYFASEITQDDVKLLMKLKKMYQI